MENDLKTIATNLIVATDIITYWIEALKTKNDTESDEFIMLLEIMSTGVNYLKVIGEMLVILHEATDKDKRKDYIKSISAPIKDIKDYVSKVKMAAFNDS